MKTSACPRLFEVEALRDGRLEGTERTNFERHLTTCPACSTEARALDALGRALSHGYSESADELHVRRERTRLLAAFDRSLLGDTSGWKLRRVVLALAGVFAAVTAFFLVWSTRPSEADFQAPSAVVRAGEHAVWSRRTDGDRDRIVLERGELWIQVGAPKKRPLSVLLPDGELEDTGTTFSVAVEGNRTVHVAVEEGSVMLRLRGQPSIAIGAGESWGPARPSPLARDTPPVEPRPRPSASAEKPVAVPPPSSPRPDRKPPPAPALEASSDFREAVAALDRGDHAGAAERFARFIAEHPRDARTEDAAYLRILALERSGNEGAMRSAAREYMRRHPSGFRRTEVENLTGRGGTR